MNDFERAPGSIDDPGMKGGIDTDVDRLPPGDTADNTGGPGEPQATELDMPGPDDPVAWSFVEPDTRVVGADGEELGRVEEMLGTETEGIFHGVAVRPKGSGPARVVPADSVTRLTSAEVEVALTSDELAAAEEHRSLDD